MRSTTEDLLARCGRDRVFHNDGTPPMVAIRWDRVDTPREERWVRCSGANHDEAGILAAEEFAKRVRDAGEKLIEWAHGIEASAKLARAALAYVTRIDP